MPEAVDPVTSALTGHLTFYLLIAVTVTWPISKALLRLYTRAVRRSMRTTIGKNGVGGHYSRTVTTTAGTATLVDLPEPSTASGAETVTALLLQRPWRVALVYTAAGVAYAVIMATAQLLADGLELLPMRFVFLFWLFVWPVVPTVGIVAATTRGANAGVTAAYFLGLVVIGATAMQANSDLTWAQIVTSWVLFDLPGTILLLTYLSRRVRAVGPLILTFVLLALIGSDVIVSIAGSDDSYLRAIITVADAVGLGATSSFIALLAIGFLLFAVLGWRVLVWIGHRYEAKAMSDESVTVDAVWILFCLIHTVNLVFGHPAWALAGVAAFAAYKGCTRAGFGQLAHYSDAGTKSPALLVLRSFAIGGASERLFDVIGRHWRRLGSIQLIAGVDLVSRTVEPHEFLEFVSGRLSRRFIDSEATLDRRMQERDVAPDRDLRYRVNEFFCYDDTWKMVLTRLVRESDAVLMDLRGFSHENAGCVFELRELARVVPLQRVVFITDGRTDEALLAQTLGAGRAGVFRFRSMGRGELRKLMHALAAAASPAVRAAV